MIFCFGMVVEVAVIVVGVLGVVVVVVVVTRVVAGPMARVIAEANSVSVTVRKSIADFVSKAELS